MAIEAEFETVPSRSTKDELVIICPVPSCGDRSGNRSIELRSGKTYCWRCAQGGDILALARRYGHVIDVESPSVPTLSELNNLGDTIQVGVPKAAAFITHVELPRGFTPVTKQSTGAYVELIARMARRKNLDLEDLIAAGVGYTHQSSAWEPYAIFPIKEWGRVVYYQGRLYGNPDQPGGSTKRFPSKKVLPLGSSNWVYNWDELYLNGGIVIIVESILNVLSLRKELARRKITGYVPVAIFKHAVSRVQLTKILTCAIKEVVLMYDGDALASAEQDAMLFSNKAKTSIAKMPVGTDANDDAVLAVDQLLARTGRNTLSVPEITV